MAIELTLPIAPFGMKDGEFNLPNPTQQKILEWKDRICAEPPKEKIPVLYLQGGVGCGKSRAVMAVVLELLTQIPGLRILWGRNDFKDLKLSIMDKFFEILPTELIVGKSEQYHYYDIACLGGGNSRIYFNDLKDIGGLGSQEFAVIVITEAHEISEQVYWALKRRCRQENVPNMFLMESEPPNDVHWLNTIDDADIEKWEISTYENWDNLPKSYTASLENMPEAWKKKFLYGKTGFIPEGKPYYQGFNLKLHTGEFDWVSNRPLILGWDFGFHHPACLITQLDIQDRWLWLREIIGRDITIDKFAQHVLGILNMYYPSAEIIHYGDPAVVQKNDKSEKTSAEILANMGIIIHHKSSQYRERKEIIERKLATLIGEKPALLIDSRYCKTAIDGFLGGYHYPEKAVGPLAELPVRDGFYEHIMNAGEYIAVNIFTVRKREDFRGLPRRAISRFSLARR